MLSLDHACFVFRLFSLVFFLTFDLSALPTPTPNLVLNGDFEAGKSDWMGAFDIDTEIFKQGFQSARLQVWGKDGGEIQQRSTTHGINPQKKYVFSEWIRTKGITTKDGVFVRLMMLGRARQIGWLVKDWRNEILQTGGTRDWTRYEIALPAFHSETSALAIYLMVRPGVTGTVWFDDLRLFETPESGTPAKSPADPVGKETANLLVNGGFERSPLGWEGGALDEKICRTGKRSMRLEGKNDPVSVVGPRIEVNPQNRYVFSLGVKTKDISTADGVFASFMQYTKSGVPNGWATELPKTQFLTTGGTRNWTRKKMILPLLPTTASVDIRLNVAKGVKGTVWFDDLALVAGERYSEPEMVIAPAGGEQNVFDLEDKARFNVRLRNLPEGVYALKYQITDVWGNVAGQPEMAFDIKVGKIVEKEILFGETPGYFVFAAQVFNQNHEVVLEDFCYLYGGRESAARYETNVAFGILPKSLPNRLGRDPFTPIGFGTWILSETEYPLLKKAGINWTMSTHHWESYEPQKGKFVIKEDSVQAEIKSLQANHLNYYILFWGGPSWAKRASKAGADGWWYDRDAWANYVKYVAKLYKGKVKYWEPWPEPAWAWHGTQDEYLEWIKVTHKALKEVDPENQLMGPADAAIDFRVLKELFDRGGDRYFDVISDHAYRRNQTQSPDESNLLGDLRQLKELMKNYGPAKDLWITEVGYSTGSGFFGQLSELDQASYLAQLFIESASAGVKVLNWHCFIEWGNANDHEDKFGIFRGPRPYTRPKPAYLAFAALIRNIGGMEYRGELDYLGPTVKAFLFKDRSSDETTLAVWDWVKNENRIALDLDAPQATVVEVDGRSRKVPLEAGILRLTMKNKTPYYVVGNFPSLINRGKMIGPGNQKVDGVPGQETPLTCTLTNPFPRPLIGRILLEGPEADWKIEPTSLPINVPTGGSQKCAFRVSIPANAEYRTYGLFGKIFEGNKLIGKYVPRINVIQPLRIEEVRPAFADHLTPKIVVSLKNVWKDAYQGKISLDVMKDSVPKASTLLPFTIPGNGAIVLEDTFPKERLGPGPVYSCRATLRTQDGLTTESTETINFTPCLHRSQPVVVDGDLKDWAGVPAIEVDGKIYNEKQYKGPSDLSGRFYTAWDKKFFYFAAQVHDDVFYQPAANGEGMWCGDAIQFGISRTNHISFNPLVAFYGGDNYEYGFGLLKTGPTVWRWISPDKRNPPGKVGDIKLAIKKHDGGLTYEAAIPWSDLTPITPATGETIYFALVLTDRDDPSGPSKARGWFEGVWGAKDPRLFGKLILVDQ